MQNESTLAEIRSQVWAAWQEAWWAKVPHSQLGRGRDGNLKWYW